METERNVQQSLILESQEKFTTGTQETQHPTSRPDKTILNRLGLLIGQSRERRCMES